MPPDPDPPELPLEHPANAPAEHTPAHMKRATTDPDFRLM